MKKNKKYSLVINETEDGERIYLMDKKTVIIDFWEEFGSDNVEEFNENGEDYLNVIFEDYNATDCVGLVDFSGNILIRKCIEYEFIENNIKLLQLGYMFSDDQDDFNGYWRMLNSEEIFALQSIDFLYDHNIFLVDNINCYDIDLNYLGNKYKEVEKEDGTNYMILEVINSIGDFQLRYQGLSFNGKIIMEAQYEYIYHICYDSKYIEVGQGFGDYVIERDEFLCLTIPKKVKYGEGDKIKVDYYLKFFTAFEHKIGSLHGIVILDNDNILYKKEQEADEGDALFIDQNWFLIYFKLGAKISITLYDNIAQKETSYLFDEFFSISFSDLLSDSKSLYYGIDKSTQTTTIFSIDKFDYSSFSCRQVNTIDIQKHLSDLLMINKII